MKRGQITLFIALGIILLFSAGTYFYLNAGEKSEPDISSKRGPVDNFVYNCIYDAGKDALLRLGNQGGYVNLPEEVLNNPSSFISIDPNRLAVVPHWYYKGVTRIPSIEYMERSISDYVKENALLCIANFSALSNQFQITVLGEMMVETKINDESVVVDVKYPFEAFDRKTQKTSFADFSAVYPVKLRKMVEFAKEILAYQRDNAFLENITIDLMGLDGRIPFSGLEFSCDRKKWQLLDVKKALQESLYINFPYIRFKNGDYLPFRYPESDYGKKTGLEDAYQYFHFFTATSQNSYSGISANVIYYPQFDLGLNARPMKRQGVLESGRSKGLDVLSYLCVQIYHFTYDVKYPVIVLLKDKNAFRKEGFALRFGMPVTIDHNAPTRTEGGRQEISFDTRFDPDFCTEPTGREVTLRATGSDGAYFGIELNEVNMTYRCFAYECPLGATKNTDGEYKLVAKIPTSCSGGIVRAEKEGYVAGEAPLLGEELSIPITRLKKVKVSFRTQIDKALGVDKLFEKGERVAYRLESGDFERMGFYDLTTPSSTELIFDDTTYVLEATLMNGEDDVIGGFIGNVTIKYSDIENANEVVFGVVKKSFVPILDTEKQDLMMYLYGTAYQSSLKPLFR